MKRRTVLGGLLALLLLPAVAAETAEEEADAKDDEEDLVVFDKERPAPEPMEGKALVVVMRPAKIGYAVKSWTGSFTIAYLQKGGLFNRLERYEEALRCYELALNTQEKPRAN